MKVNGLMICSMDMEKNNLKMDQNIQDNINQEEKMELGHIIGLIILIILGSGKIII